MNLKFYIGKGLQLVALGVLPVALVFGVQNNDPTFEIKAIIFAGVCFLLGQFVLKLK